MTDWTKEEDEAFNEVEKNSNLGKQILKDIQGQPYHWEADAIKAAVLIEREACARIADEQRYAMNISLTSHPVQNGTAVGIANAIRARGQA
jgi:hypothetical protein